MQYRNRKIEIHAFPNALYSGVVWDRTEEEGPRKIIFHATPDSNTERIMAEIVQHVDGLPDRKVRIPKPAPYGAPRSV